MSEQKALVFGLGPFLCTIGEEAMFVILFENIGVVYGPFNTEANAKRWLEDVLIDPDEVGYTIRELIAPAPEYQR